MGKRGIGQAKRTAKEREGERSRRDERKGKKPPNKSPVAAASPSQVPNPRHSTSTSTSTSKRRRQPPHPRFPPESLLSSCWSTTPPRLADPLDRRWWWLRIELRGQIHHPRRRPPRSTSRPALSPTSPLFPNGGRRASQWTPAAHAEDSSPPPRWLLILPSIAAAAHGEFQFLSLPFPHI